MENLVDAAEASHGWEREKRFRELREKGAPWLARLADEQEGAQPYRAQDGRAYSDWPRDGTLLNSLEFRNWLSKLYTDRSHGKSPVAGLVSQAITLLQGRATEGHRLATRIAEIGGHILIDRGSDEGDDYLQVTEDGWEFCDRVSDYSGWREWKGLPPVDDVDKLHFRKPTSMGVLPKPEAGGNLEELRQFVNIPDDDAWLLYKGFLLMALNPFNVPYPILLLNGQAGSAKSTTARFTRDLIDPSRGTLRACPRDERDLLIAANNGLLIAYDNVSTMPHWLSDAFCRLATGAAVSTRTLFTDSDESLFTGMRPVLMTGIEQIGTRGDFLQRSLTITLPYIPDNERRPELELWAAFGKARPRILGGLLDTVSEALRNLPHTKITGGLPRMADFATWAAAGLDGGTDGSFMAAYRRSIDTNRQVALDFSIVATALLKLMESRKIWTGTPTELLTDLNSLVTPAKRTSKAWPKDATRLSGQLRRSEPDLLAANLKLDAHRGTSRSLTISRTDTTRR